MIGVGSSDCKSITTGEGQDEKEVRPLMSFFVFVVVNLMFWL